MTGGNRAACVRLGRCVAVGCGFVGMGGSMNGSEFFYRDLGIDLGAVDVTVAQHGLDKADVGPVFQHVGGHRVAQ